MLVHLGRKLNINSKEAIQKALEFLRIVNVRCGSGSLSSLNLSGSCTSVICLEIAALSCGQSTDKVRTVWGK